MTPGEIFSQPFTQLFGPTPPVFEGFKSLNVNDIIQWLVLLVCLFCLAFRDKRRLTWITTLIPTLENKDAAPQPEPVPQPDTVPQPASGINHPDWVKEIGEMLREYLSPVVASLAPAARKPSPCPDKGESDSAAAKPTDVTTVQVPAEPQGQPQPAAVAPVETKKYKVKSEHPGNKDKKGGPSQPGKESEVEIITESLTYESLRNLQKDLARRGHEAYTAWLLRVWDLIGTGVQLDSSEAKNLGPLTQDSGVNQGETRENRVYWTVWIRWPGTSEPQKYEALVDTGSQCTLIPSEYVGTEPISIARVTGRSQELTVGSRDFLGNGYYKDSKGFRWAFRIAAVEAEGIKKLNSLPGLSENPSTVGLLKVEEQRVPVATSTVHRRQYRTNRDAMIPIHKMIRELESQGVVSKTHSPFNSPIWPVRKPDGEWRLTVDYRAWNEVTPPLSAAVPDMLELQYELESKAAKWYATIDIANAFFSIPLAAECRPQFAFTWRGVQYTWNRLPQGWKHSPTICHGLIQAALEKGEAPEHLQYIDDIIVWGNTAIEVFEKGEKIIHILLKASFAIKPSKVKGPAREIQFLGVK
ncbi:hypothetical protein DUI87_07197 [Hirundo rustica rustica]|uniref:ribonuclease H n=1 Tax=Hirundo rustica rustica TaxID=333673 RepID=A0A3M0KP33_HIRRU|nr:hypothetical protein DUI87_07197 [Hirundo rustica rustica]